MILGTAILIRYSYKIIGIECAKGRGITLPGGKVEAGETYKEAARRECEEEAGLFFTHLDLVFHAMSDDNSYCFTYEPKVVLTSRVLAVMGQDFGSGKVGLYDPSVFTSSGHFRGYYDALFDTLGITS